MKKQLAYAFFFLSATLIFFSVTNTDITLQDAFFDFETKQWAVTPKDHAFLTYLFYMGFKIFVGIIGFCCLALFLISFKKASLKPYRFGALMLLLSLILVPVIVAGSKQVTNGFCPKQVDRYGGVVPHKGIFSSLPDTLGVLKKGKCFPAGHATSGFALMALFFCFKDERRKRLGLGIGIFAGWLTGNYQMLRGEHFISHTLTTMIASWIIILLINAFLCRFSEHFSFKNTCETTTS